MRVPTLMIASLMVTTIHPALADPEYSAKIEKWRIDHEQGLKAPYGWLAQAGLFLLEEGKSSVGSAPESTVKLPKDLPAYVGDLEVKGEQIKFVPNLSVIKKAGLELLLNDAKLEGPTAPLTWKGARQDKIRVGRIQLITRERNIGQGARVSMRDPETIDRKTFKGLKWYPIKPEYRVEARFIPDSERVKIHVPNSQGQESGA